MSLIVNGTEIENVVVINKSTGVSTEIETMQDKNGNIIFEKASSTDVILSVTRVDATISSTASSFVGIAVDTDVNTTAYITYGGITKTVPYNSSNIGVYFGKYGTEEDDGTPVSGDMIITGAQSVRVYSYSIDKNTTGYCSCITGIKSWGLLDNVGTRMFYKCPITSIKIPKQIKIIRNNAFYECTNLSSVTIAEGLEEIEGSAFYKCTALNTINLPSTLTDMQDSVFSYSAISSINSSVEGVIDLRNTKLKTYNNMVNYTDKVYRLYIPNTVETLYSTRESLSSINSDTDNIANLENLVNLQSLSLANYSTVVHTFTRLNLPNISSLINLKLDINADNITKINTNTTGLCDLSKYTAFNESTLLYTNCSKLTLSSSLSAIPTKMFQQVYSITDIIIPSSVKSIGANAFAGCGPYHNKSGSVVFNTTTGWQYYNSSTSTWTSISSSILSKTGYISGTLTALTALCSSSSNTDTPGYANYEWRNTN